MYLFVNVSFVIDINSSVQKLNEVLDGGDAPASIIAKPNVTKVLKEPRPLFSELEQLRINNNGEAQWHETAR